jgi:hypothetical protein
MRRSQPPQRRPAGRPEQTTSAPFSIARLRDPGLLVILPPTLVLFLAEYNDNLGVGMAIRFPLVDHVQRMIHDLPRSLRGNDCDQNDLPQHRGIAAYPDGERTK